MGFWKRFLGLEPLRVPADVLIETECALNKDDNARTLGAIMRAGGLSGYGALIESLLGSEEEQVIESLLGSKEKNHLTHCVLITYMRDDVCETFGSLLNSAATNQIESLGCWMKAASLTSVAEAGGYISNWLIADRSLSMTMLLHQLLAAPSQFDIVRLDCAGCMKRLTIDRRCTGTFVDCPKCGYRIRVPDPRSGGTRSKHSE
jgi:hypothetical protein